MKKIKRWVAVIMVCLLTLTGAETAGMDVGVNCSGKNFGQYKEKGTKSISKISNEK